MGFRLQIFYRERRSKNLESKCMNQYVLSVGYQAMIFFKCFEKKISETFLDIVTAVKECKRDDSSN